MHFRGKKILAVTLSILMVIQSLQFSQWSSFLGSAEPVDASFTQNENAGQVNISFSDLQGILSTSGIVITNSLARLSTGSLVGEIISSNIQPVSLNYWKNITTNIASLPTNSSISASLLTCAGAAIAGYQNNTVFPWDISSLDKNTYPCIRVKYQLSKVNSSDVTPILASSAINYKSLPYLQTSISAPVSKAACGNMVYTVNLSNSYANDTGVILYMPIPQSGRGISGNTALYQQFPEYNPTFISATSNGNYTTGGTTIFGNVIPANSVYWNIPVAPAGLTNQYNMTLYIPCGTQTGVQYQTQSFADGINANATSGNKVSTSITSAPSALHLMSVSNALIINNQYWVYSGYSSTVGYNDFIANDSTATEDIFNPSLTINFSNVLTGLQLNCSVGSFAAAQGKISGLPTGSWSGSNYIIDKNYIGVTSGKNQTIGNGQSLSYQVDYGSCTNANDTFTVVSTFAGNNITPIVQTATVKILTQFKGEGTFSKGLRGTFSDSKGNQGGVYDNCGISDAACKQSSIYYTYPGDTFTYTLNVANRGITALKDFSFEDYMPAGVTLLGSSLNYDTYFGATGSMTTGTGLSGQLQFGVNACLNSSFLPTTGGICAGAPSSFSVDLLVKVNDVVGTGACQTRDIINTGSAQLLYAATDVSATSFTGLNGGVINDYVLVHVKPLLGNFDANALALVSGPTDLNVYDSGSYSFVVTNNGKDSILNPTATIHLPSITVNNQPQYLSISNVSGGTVNYSQLSSGIVAVTLPILAPNQTRIISYKIDPISVGIQNNTQAAVTITMSGNDDSCGTITATTSKTVILHGTPSLQLSLYRNFSQILQSGTILYNLPLQNVGRAVSSNTYIVDIVPDNTEFVEAYTNSSQAPYTYTCANCKVYFSAENANLPQTISATTAFNNTMIQNYFILGSQSSTGIRQSPFGTGTKYVAYKMDDNNGTFPVGPTKNVGFKVQDVSTPLGGLITNKAQIISNELLAAIPNPVQTTVLATPNLFVDIYSDKDTVAACEDFDWIVDYRHDGSQQNTQTIITTTIPSTAVLLTGVNSITHAFNAAAISSGAIAGSHDISGNPYFSMFTVGTSTIVTFNVTSYLSGDLFPGWGGSIVFKMKSNCSNVSNTIMNASVLGSFENALVQDNIDDNDDVNVINPDLWIRKQVDQNHPVVGETANYTLTISNKGLHSASGVQIQDDLPIGMCFVTGSVGVTNQGWSIGQPIVSGSCAGGNQQSLIWDLSNTLLMTGQQRGYMPENSADIYINYAATVISSVTPGQTLTNGASVSNVFLEDNNYTNSTTKDVIVAIPDPYITISQPTTVDQGATFALDVQYGNNNRQCVMSGYSTITMPNYFVPSGIANVKIIGLSAGPNQTIYYQACPYYQPFTGSDTVPDFSYDNPASNGWTTTQPSQVCYVAIRHNTDLCDTDGPQYTQFQLQAKRADDSTLPAGIKLESVAVITGGNNDTDSTNNNAVADTFVPSLDLYTSITGSNEGGYPGVQPGQDQNYTVNFGLRGTQNSCANYINVFLSSGVQLKPTFTDFTTLSIFDSYSQSVQVLNNSGAPIVSNVPIKVVSSGSTSSGTLLTFQLGDPYANVCLPKNTKGSFHIYTSIKNTAPDMSVSSAYVSIGQDNGSLEDTLLNNNDETNVSVYLADLLVRKSGISDNNSDGVFSATDGFDSSTTTAQGKNIQYKIGYDNIGNISAANTVISEEIPKQTCFIVGSMANLSSGVVIEYSNDSAATYAYTPVGAAGVQDCNVTNFRVRFLTDLPAPSHFVVDDFQNNYARYNITGNNSSVPYVSLVINRVLNVSTLAGNNVGGNAFIRPATGKYLTYQQQNGSAGFDVYYYNGNSSSAINLSALAGETTNVFASTPVMSADGTKVSWFENAGLYYYNGSSVINLRALAGLPANSAIGQPYMSANGKVIWRGTTTSTGYDLFYYNGSTVIDLSTLAGIPATNDVANGFTYSINADGTKVIWSEGNGASGVDAFYYNGSTVVNLSALAGNTGTGSAFLTTIADDGKAAWQEQNGAANYDAYYYNGTTAVNVSALAGNTGNNNISRGGSSNVGIFMSANGMLTWTEQNGSANTDMYYYNGTTATDLSTLAGNVGNNDIQLNSTFSQAIGANGSLLWTEQNGAFGYDAYYYNGSSVTNVSALGGVVTAGNATFPFISLDGKSAIWNESIAGSNTDMFFYDGTTVKNLSALGGNTANNPAGYAYASNGKVAWMERNGTTSYMMYYYNGSTVTNISDLGKLAGTVYIAGTLNLSIDGNGLGWVQKQTSSSVNDVYYYNDSIPTFITTGSYTTILSATGSISSWDKLIVGQSVQAGLSDIKYTIYPVVGTDCYTGGGVLMGPTSIVGGALNISSIPTSNTKLCITANLTLYTGAVGPKINSMLATWRSPDTPYFTFNVKTTTGVITSTTIDNHVSIISDTLESTGLNNDADNTFTISNTDLEVTESVDKGSVHSGDLVTYTINYKNNGPQDASGVVLKEYLPAGVTYVSSSIPITGNDFAVGTMKYFITGDVCFDQFLANTGIYYTTINNFIAANFYWAGVFTINDYLWNFNGYPTSVSGGAGWSTMLSNSYGYPTSIGFSGATASEFGVDILTPVTTNCGKYISGAVTAQGFTLGYLPVGSGGSYTITVQVNSSVQAGDVLTALAKITSDTSEITYDNNQDNVVSIVGDVTNLYTTIDVGTYYQLGDYITGTVTYGNNGNVIATGSVLTISIDTGMDYIGYSLVSGPISSCAFNTGTSSLICNATNIVTLDAGVITIQTKVHNDVSLLAHGTILAFTSSIASALVGVETNLFDNIATDYIYPQAGALSNIAGRVYLDVSANSVFDGGDSYMNGQSVLLIGKDIYGTLYGPDPIAYPAIYNTYITTAGLTGSSYVIVPPSQTNSQGQYFFIGLNPGTYQTHMLLPVGYTSVSSTGGYLANGTKSGQGSLDNGLIATDHITNIVLGVNEYSNDNTFGIYLPVSYNVYNNIGSTLTGGKQIDVAVEYGNNSPNMTTNGLVTVGLDSGSVYISDSNGGVYNALNNTVTFAVGNINAFTSGTLHIHTAVLTGLTIPLNGYLFKFTSQIGVNEGENISPFYTDNVSTSLITLYPRPSIDVQKTPDNQVVLSGGTAVFTITVSNNGDSDLQNIALTDPLSTDCNRNIASLAVGNSAIYSCLFTGVQTNFVNTITASGSSASGDIATGMDTANIYYANILIDKSPANQIVGFHSGALFTIIVTNNGGVDLTGVAVTDPLTPACSTTIGFLAQGQSTGYACQRANVQTGFTNIATVNATAICTGTGCIPLMLTEVDSAQVDVAYAPAIEIQKSPNSQNIISGGTALFTITVTNTGSTGLVNVEVFDPLSTGCNMFIGFLGMGASTGYTCHQPDVEVDFINTAYVSGYSLSGDLITASATGSVAVYMLITPPTGGGGGGGGGCTACISKPGTGIILPPIHTGNIILTGAIKPPITGATTTGIVKNPAIKKYPIVPISFPLIAPPKVVPEGSSEVKGSNGLEILPGKLPATGPDTELPAAGTPVAELKKVGVGIARDKRVLTEQYDWIIPHDQNTVSEDLSYWLNLLPYKEDKSAPAYIVIPSLGVVAPIVDILPTDPNYEKMMKGKNVEVNDYLRGGVLRYPGSVKAGENGNMIIFGHSSYWINDAGRYKTIFTSLMLLKQNDKVWIYEKNNKGEYVLSEYKTEKSYETKPTDVSVLLQSKDSEITLFTCTPVGGVKGRWIVKGILDTSVSNKTVVADPVKVSDQDLYPSFTPKRKAKTVVTQP